MQLNKMVCPVIKREIDELICTDVSHVAENLHPERFAPDEFRAVPNYKSICQNCMNNPFNEELADEQR